MGLETTVKPKTIKENNKGIVYSISHGSGGYKSNYEAVKVSHRPSHCNKPFKVVFVNPGGSKTLEEFDKLSEAIKFAQKIARKNLKRTVTRNYTPTTKSYRSYPTEIPEDLSEFI